MKKIIISSVAAFAFFAIAGSVSAINATEIYTPASGFLKYGSGMGAKVSQMSNVMAAQKALNACTNSSLVVDGKFGMNTTTVFKNFQASKGIAQDGIIGPVTAGKLADCSGGTTSNPTTVSGGAGDLEDFDILSTYSNEDVLEGADDVKVAAFEIEADNGSDLAITNVRIALENTASGSTRLNKYVDTVKVWQGSKEVGSAEADDFSENNDSYSKSIALSNAVVKDGEKSKFYVSVDAVSSIDSADMSGADWELTFESVRFMDGQGAIITDSTTGELGGTVNFQFEDLASSGDIEIKVTKGSNSPDAQTVEVDSTSDTNDVDLLEFKIKSTGTDSTIDQLTFDITVSGATSDEIVKEYKLLMDGEEIDSMDGASVSGGELEFTDLEDEIAIDEDDTVTFKLVADINDLDGNFGNGDSILASLSAADFASTTKTVIDDAEEDTVATGDRSGSAIGEVQTFFEDGIMVKLVSTSAVKTAGDAGANESDSGLFSITFDVTAFGSDVFIDKSAPLAAGGSGESDLTITGTGTVTSEITSTDADEGTDGFEVIDGTTERFTITTNILATATGFFRVQLGSIAYALSDADATTYYSSDLEDFKTSSLSLTDR